MIVTMVEYQEIIELAPCPNSRTGSPCSSVQTRLNFLLPSSLCRFCRKINPELFRRSPLLLRAHLERMPRKAAQTRRAAPPVCFVIRKSKALCLTPRNPTSLLRNPLRRRRHNEAQAKPRILPTKPNPPVRRLLCRRSPCPQEVTLSHCCRRGDRPQR